MLDYSSSSFVNFTPWSFLFLYTAYNLRQKVREKLTKLSKIRFSMECFTADFWQIFTKKRQNLAL